MYETIPQFHDTVKRLRDFKDAQRKDVKNRARKCKPEIEFVLSREDDCGVLMKQLEEGKLPLRVTHNDTKLNNILFDADTDEGLCLSLIHIYLGWHPLSRVAAIRRRRCPWHPVPNDRLQPHNCSG